MSDIASPPQSQTPTELPTAVCSLVWSSGHPWVLDGEPGIHPALVPRRWVGIGEDGYPAVRTAEEMDAAGWSLVHDDRANQFALR